MPDSAPSLGRRALTIGLVLTVSAAAFEALAVAAILPQTVREIDGLAYYGWAFTAFMLANLLGIPLSGRAADRRGPIPPFLVGLGLFIAGLVVAGSARVMPVLVAARLLQGAGAAALSTVGYVAVARAYPGPEQPRMMALLSSAWVLPGLFGPALGAAMGRAFGWRSVFLGLVPVTSVAGALALSGLRGLGAPATPAAPPAPTADAAAPVRHAALLVLGVALTLLGSRGPHPLAQGAAVLLGLALALGALRRLLPQGTLRARAGLPAALAVLGLIHFAFFTCEAFLPLALTELRGQPGLGAAALTAGTLTWTGGSWLQARIGERAPRTRLLRLGLWGMLLGLGGVTLTQWPRVPALLTVPLWGLCGLGMGVAFQVATLVVIKDAPAGREGELTATMQIANTLAIAVGTGVGGDVLARLMHGGRVPSLGIAAVDTLALFAALAALAIGARVTPVGGPAPPPPAWR